MGILSGYRVVDLSIAMAGPFAAMRLGDLGADVIKVEPVAGEWQRHTSAGGAAGRQVNASFLSLNRNKRSLAVNLKSAEGREIVLSLARRSDVFLQNYRPGVAERLGMDYESIRAARPDIVYVSISGFGETGPYADRPGQDMLDSAIAVQAQELSIFTVGGVPQHRGSQGHGHAYIRAPYGTFATADGFIALAFPSLAKLGAALGIPQFAGMDDETDGHARRDEIIALVSARLPER